jgi:hypothetical protein
MRKKGSNRNESEPTIAVGKPREKAVATTVLQESAILYEAKVIGN